MPFTTAGLNSATDGVKAAGRAIGLHTADPGATGTSEVAGGSYARQQTTWATSANGSSTGTPVSISVPAATSVSFWSVWSAVTGGVFLYGGPLPATESFGSAGTFTHTPTITSTN